MIKILSRKIISINLFPFQVLTYILLAITFGIYFAAIAELEWQILQPISLLVVSLLLFVAFINFLLKNRILVFVSWLLLFMVAGSTLYSWQKFVHFPAIDISEKKVELTGTVINDPYFSYKNQELVLETTYSGKSFLLLVKAPRHPKYAVGSKVAISGVIQEPGIIEDFDYKRYLRGKKIAYIMLTPKEVVALEGEPSLGAQLLRYLYSFRHIFEQSLNKSLHEPYSSLAVGIITGAKRSMPEELVSDLSVAGLTHIVALSGFNITIIIVAITALLAPFLNRKRLFLVGGLLVFAFVVMTGASASVVRAGIFSLLILLGKTLARKAYQTNILLLTALLMLVINPFILTDDIGFQLSFLAFCGIIYLSPAVKSSIEKSKLKILPEYIKGPLIETLSAQIMVLPLISFAFGKISLVAPISNILVLWIIPLAMFLTFVAAIIAWVVPALAGLSAYLAWPALYYIVIVSKLSSKLPWAMIEIDKSSYSVSIIFYLLIFIYWHSQKKMVRNEKQTL